MAVILGSRVKDHVTGFSGIVTGRVEYLTGCAQVFIQPSTKPDGEWIESRWIDEPRLVTVDPEPILHNPTKDRGADQEAPKR